MAAFHAEFRRPPCVGAGSRRCRAALLASIEDYGFNPAMGHLVSHAVRDAGRVLVLALVGLPFLW